jgi:hypothetical protein
MIILITFYLDFYMGSSITVAILMTFIFLCFCMWVHLIGRLFKIIRLYFVEKRCIKKGICMQHIFVVEKAKMAELWPFDNIWSMLFTSPYHACCTCYKMYFIVTGDTQKENNVHRSRALYYNTYCRLCRRYVKTKFWFVCLFDGV